MGEVISRALVCLLGGRDWIVVLIVHDVFGGSLAGDVGAVRLMDG